MPDQIKEALKTRPSRVKAIIVEFSEGYYEKYEAIISPEYYKNGNVKKSKFTIIQKEDTLDIRFTFGCYKRSLQIFDIIGIIE